MVRTGALDRFISFDHDSGRLVCEAGVRLCDVIDLVLPRGWYPAVLPGTQFVSVGGAIANDVHGKNHHRAGTFGSHVARFELLRSNGERLVCSARENPRWFQATIGGLGLTGLITWAEIELRRVKSALVECEDIPFHTLEEFAALTADSDSQFEYTVGWFDCYSYRSSALRGIFSRGRHVDAHDGSVAQPRRTAKLFVPVSAPAWVLSSPLVRAFNATYWLSKHRRGLQRTRVEPFLFPLDAIRRWNRLYGSQGFMQLQCVFPESNAMGGLDELLATIAPEGQGSFLAVLKRFGDRVSPGLLSFPMAGISIALDFQNRGETTLALLRRCHDIVVAHGGRVYPAKDACMSALAFERGFPQWREFLPFLDPRFSSGFWERTGGALAGAK